MFGTVTVWHLIILNFLRSASGAFHSPTTFALMPLLVPKEKMAQINGFYYFFPSLIALVGPIAGAGLLAIFDIQDLLWIDIITFVIAAITLFLLKFPKEINTKAKELSINNGINDGDTAVDLPISDLKPSLFAQIMEGFKFISEIPGLMSIFVVVVLGNFFMQPLNVLIPNFIKVEHGGSPQNLAIFMGCMQAGMIIGGLLSSLIRHYKSIILMMVLTFLIIGLSLILLAITPDGKFLYLYIIAGVLTLFTPFSTVIFQTSIMMKIPQEKLGRVVASVSTMSQIAVPLGIIIAGPLADLVGSVTWVLLGCGVLELLVTALFFSKKSHNFLRSMQKDHDMVWEQSQQANKR